MNSNSNYVMQSHMAQKPVLRGEVGCACVVGSRRCGGGFGGGGVGGGGVSAAAKTSGLGYYDERPTTALETARREAMFEFRSRWDLDTTWGPTFATSEGGVGLVDNAGVKNKATKLLL